MKPSRGERLTMIRLPSILRYVAPSLGDRHDEGAVVDQPLHGETLDAYLRRHEIVHFTAHEVRNLRRIGVVAPEPPLEWWHRIIPTLELAESLRDQFGPLSIGNGYRPRKLNKRVGGARSSQHLYFRALDLDLPSGDDRGRQFQEAAARLWLHFGDRYKMGLGFYARRTRIHIDTGFRRRYWKKKYVKPILEGVR